MEVKDLLTVFFPQWAVLLAQWIDKATFDMEIDKCAARGVYSMLHAVNLLKAPMDATPDIIIGQVMKLSSNEMVALGAEIYYLSQNNADILSHLDKMQHAISVGGITKPPITKARGYIELLERTREPLTEKLGSLIAVPSADSIDLTPSMMCSVTIEATGKLLYEYRLKELVRSERFKQQINGIDKQISLANVYSKLLGIGKADADAEVSKKVAEMKTLLESAVPLLLKAIPLLSMAFELDAILFKDGVKGDVNREFIEKFASALKNHHAFHLVYDESTGDLIDTLKPFTETLDSGGAKQKTQVAVGIRPSRNPDIPRPLTDRRWMSE